MNGKQQEIRELTKQIKQLQDRVSSLQAQIDSDVKVGEWYGGIDSVVLITDISNNDISCISFKDDREYGVLIDNEDWYSHAVFNNDFSKITQQEASKIFYKYLEDLQSRFDKQLLGG